MSLEFGAEILSTQRQQLSLSRQTTDDITSVLEVGFQDLRTLILQTRDGRTKTIASNPANAFIGEDETQRPSKVTFFRSDINNNNVQSTVRDLQRIVSRARECLHFDRLSERQMVIREAHFTTFNWIFQDDCPKTKSDAFSSFPAWLEHGQGCYWIQGKAGSGKSTLMKRIHEHETTHKHLKKWGDEAEVLTASYFFWYQGFSLQRTLEGTLRSLLYTLLEKSPQHVIVALPELFIEATNLEQGIVLPSPSPEKLQRWFQQLLEALEKSQKLKVCFFIDGLDECSGEERDLVDLAKFFLHIGGKFKAVKFVLASRPLPVFVDALAHLPGLRVQDLTMNDIIDFTRTLICKDRYVVKEEDIEELVDVISQRSQGVFLWVAVVIQSVLEGLRNGDNVHELRDRVKELPAELSVLYKRMLDAINPRYRQEAAEMLLLVATNFDPAHPKQDGPSISPLSAVQLSFALQGPEIAIQAPIQPFSDQELKDEVEKLEPRLRSRCLGLIEFKFDPRIDIDGPALVESGQELLAMTIVPFHRTAIEFLLDEEVSKYLKEQTGERFDAFDSLFCSCIRMVKIATSLFSRPPIESPAEVSLWTYLLHVYFVAFDAERRGSGICKAYIDELDRVLDVQWKNTPDSLVPRLHDNARWFPALINSKAPGSDSLMPSSNEFEETARDLDDELCAQLERRYQQIGFIRILPILTRIDDLTFFIEGSSQFSPDDATLLLRLLLQARFSPRSFGKIQLYFDPCLETAVSALLAAGADSNAMDTEDSAFTIWTRFLWYIFPLLTAKKLFIMVPEGGGEALVSMVEKFIAHGADPSALVPFHDELAIPSIFMQTMHRIAVEGVSVFVEQEESLMLQKFTALRDPLLRVAEILRLHEDKAGLHSRRSRARTSLSWLRSARKSRGRSSGGQKDGPQGKESLAPLRKVRNWASRSKSTG